MPEIPLQGLHIDTSSQQTLVAQVYQNFRRRIVNGVFQEGDKLPATRRLADELGISRSTIIIAYEQLVAEGFARARKGSGVYVSEIGEIEDLSLPGESSDLAGSAESTLQSINALHPGQPDARLFPVQQWSKCVSRVVRSDPTALIHNHDLFGDRVLRDQICRYLYDWRGLKTDPSQIIITAGAGDALELAINTLTRTATHIYVENPGYVQIREFIQRLNLPMSLLTLDSHGARIPQQLSEVTDQNLAILTPSSQFPLGGAMPHKRRMQFIQWARDNNGWIIEDDYDSEFRYAGRPIPSLASFDSTQRTLYVGSFAKIFSNGLRLGFIVIPQQLQEGVIDTLKSLGSKASIMPQRPLALFLESGEFYRHIRRVRRIYAERRLFLINLIRTRLPEVSNIKDHKAGMHLVIRLPDHLSDSGICREAAENGVTCSALSGYYASPPVQNALLIGYCSFNEEEMTQAMKVLVKQLKAAGL